MAAAGPRWLESAAAAAEACQKGDFEIALRFYVEAIEQNPSNPLLYSNRSAIHLRLSAFDKALNDANLAKDLAPRWPKAYFRQGTALHHLALFPNAIAAFASGLALAPRNVELLQGLVQSAFSSKSMARRLEAVFANLFKWRLDRSSFIVVAVIGQELLAWGNSSAAAVVLEAALNIGTSSPKLKGSVLSSLASAHWALDNKEKAMEYMRQDLFVAKSTNDVEGECRAQSNLGAAHFTHLSFDAATACHRFQLVISMRLKNRQMAAHALGALGHIYAIVGDLPNALSMHKRCVLMLSRSKKSSLEVKEIGNCGSILLALGDVSEAISCHEEMLARAQEMDESALTALAHSNLGVAHHYGKNHEQAIVHHNHVLALSQELKNKKLEARALAAIGHAARCLDNLDRSRACHEKELEIALKTQDKKAEARACSSLGRVYFLNGDFDASIKLHQQHLNLVEASTSPSSSLDVATALSNVGVAQLSLGRVDEAFESQSRVLSIAQSLGDEALEASVRGNLGNVRLFRGDVEGALQCYQKHVALLLKAQGKIKEDLVKALFNVGHLQVSQGHFARAVPFYASLVEAGELKGAASRQLEAKAWHHVGHAQMRANNVDKAREAFENYLAVSKLAKDRVGIGNAYVNIGFCLSSLENHAKALEAFRFALALAHLHQDYEGKCRIVFYIGATLLRQKRLVEAAQVFATGFNLAKSILSSASSSASFSSVSPTPSSSSLECSALSCLGFVHKELGRSVDAFHFFAKESRLREDSADHFALFRLRGFMGELRLAFGAALQAQDEFEAQRRLADETGNAFASAVADRNLATSFLESGRLDEAASLLRQHQTLLLDKCVRRSERVNAERIKGLLLMGEIQEVLEDFKSMQQTFSLCLSLATRPEDQDLVFRGLGVANRSLGNDAVAVAWLEKRLVLAHATQKDSKALSAAYGELGLLHALLGRTDKAASCLHHQLDICQQLRDPIGQCEALSALASVFQRVDLVAAKSYHEAQLPLLKRLDPESSLTKGLTARVCGGLGLVCEESGKIEEALGWQEEHLALAVENGDAVAKSMALSSLARLWTRASDFDKALHHAETLSRIDDSSNHSTLFLQGFVLWEKAKSVADDEEALSRSLDALTRACQAAESRILDGLDPVKKNCAELVDKLRRAYEALQNAMMLKNETEASLSMAEKRASLYLKDSRRDGKRTSDDQRVLNTDHPVIYLSLADHHLLSWLLRDGVVVASHRAPLDSPTRGVFEKTPSLTDHLRQSFTVSSNNETSTDSNCVSYVNDAVIRGRRRDESPELADPTSIGALYRLTLEPFERHLEVAEANSKPKLEIVVVGDSDSLSLLPFALLRKSEKDPFLFQRFDLVMKQSLSDGGEAAASAAEAVEAKIPIIAIGNPSNATEDSPLAVAEATMIAEMFNQRPLLGSAATKSSLLQLLPESEVVHLNCVCLHIFSSPVIVLAHPKDSLPDLDVETSRPSENFDETALHSGAFLTPTEIAALCLDAVKVVVLSFGHETSSSSQASPSPQLLVDAFLDAGVGAVVISLFPSVSTTATKTLFKHFYKNLIDRKPVHAALAESQRHAHYMTNAIGGGFDSDVASWAALNLISRCSEVRLERRERALTRAAMTALTTRKKSENEAEASEEEMQKRELKAVYNFMHRAWLNLERHDPVFSQSNSVPSTPDLSTLHTWGQFLAQLGFRFESDFSHPSFFSPPFSDPLLLLPKGLALIEALLSLSYHVIQKLASVLTEEFCSSSSLFRILRNVCDEASLSSSSSSSSSPFSISSIVSLLHVDLLSALGFVVDLETRSASFSPSSSSSSSISDAFNSLRAVARVLSMASEDDLSEDDASSSSSPYAVFDLAAASDSDLTRLASSNRRSKKNVYLESDPSTVAPISPGPTPAYVNFEPVGSGRNTGPSSDGVTADSLSAPSVDGERMSVDDDGNVYLKSSLC